LNVVNSAFADMEREPMPELPLWKQPDMVELAQQIGKTLLIGGLILYLVLGVLRPMLKRMNPPPPPPLAAEQPDNNVPQVIPAPKPPPQISQHEQTLALARQLARDDPKMVANVVKQWVAGHE
jgi:flagellar M-ring protein FliF